MASVGFAVYKGRRILQLDLTGAKDGKKEGFMVIGKLNELIVKEPMNSVLALIDVSQAYLTPKILAILKEGAGKNKNYVKAAAIVGASGVKKLLMQIVANITGRNIKQFNSISEAKDWLVLQE
ncbi:hypothetical protein K8S19_11285 [bacterium]|nr:hypothetical protein [bacterium]